MYYPPIPGQPMHHPMVTPVSALFRQKFSVGFYGFIGILQPL
jgi:hypothetical protein